MPIKETTTMPIKRLYVCDFCGNETLMPTQDWHRLVSAEVPASGMVPAAVILCNACKDHLMHRNKKGG